MLRNIELFDKLALNFTNRIKFIRDVVGEDICVWSFYGHGRKISEICCTSIVYATEKKQTKVEFPEARIYEETLNILLYEGQSSSSRIGVALYLLFRKRASADGRVRKGRIKWGICSKSATNPRWNRKSSAAAWE